MGLDLVMVAVVALSGWVVALAKLRDLSIWGGIIPKFRASGFSIGYEGIRNMANARRRIGTARSWQLTLPKWFDRHQGIGGNPRRRI